jgi:hypothetical protein
LNFVGDVANAQGAEEIIMKLGKLSALSSAALLAAGVSLAMAQSSSSPSSPSGSTSQPGAAQSGKCWDAASQMIKDKADGQTAGGGRSPSGATTGAAPSGASGRRRLQGCRTANGAAFASIRRQGVAQAPYRLYRLVENAVAKPGEVSLRSGEFGFSAAPQPN